MANNGNENSNGPIKLYNSRAHIFEINETRDKWISKGDQAIPISFLAPVALQDPSAEASIRELKVIGIDDSGQTVLDTYMTAKTQFLKVSQKFGQWHDKAGTLFGFGFNSEAELTEFVETLHRLQRTILAPNSQFVQHSPNLQNNTNLLSFRPNHNPRQVDTFSETNRGLQGAKVGASETQQHHTSPSPKTTNQIQPGRKPLNSNQTNGDSVDSSSHNNINHHSHSKSQNMFGLQSRPNMIDINTMGHKVASLTNKLSPELDNPSFGNPDWQSLEQLKYENERLKQALEVSSKNTEVWHNELLNLRTNNVKLTQALQESKSHVEDWERQLIGLSEENKELKRRIEAFESSEGPGDHYKKEINHYKSYVEDVQRELRRKENEIEELQRSMNAMDLKKHNNGTDEPGLPDLSPQRSHRLHVILAKFEAKVSDLTDIQRELKNLVGQTQH